MAHTGDVANLLGPKHVAQLGAYIREQRENAQYSLRQLAQAAGVSNPYLSQIERGLRKPSAEILQQLAKALKISAETLYVQAGLLDGSPEHSGVHAGDEDGTPGGDVSAAGRVIAAISADPVLTRRQKQILREIYESFRAETAAAAAPTNATDGEAQTGNTDEAETGTARVAE
jgi:transcriptional regulator with XRE-family HTH domain